MRRIAFLLVAVAAVAGLAAYMTCASGQADGEAAPIFGVKIPPGYRDWRLISVAHEEGNLNDLRAILGNDVAIKAYREGKLPFPDGIERLRDFRMAPSRTIGESVCKEPESHRSTKLQGQRAGKGLDEIGAML